MKRILVLFMIFPWYSGISFMPYHSSILIWTFFMCRIIWFYWCVELSVSIMLSLSSIMWTQYCYEEYIRPTSYLRFLSYHDSCLRSHISFIIHQLRLRFDQIHQHDEISTEDVKLGELLEKDYYYQKLLPLVICDSVKCVYLKQHKKVLQNGVMTHVLDVSARCRSYD